MSGPAFLLYRADPPAEPGGKWRKTPLSWRTATVASPLDPVNHADRATITAAAAAFGPAYGVGIVIQPPLFLIDLDAQYINGEWSEAAGRIGSAFPGAYMETSVSGTGCHIIGRTRTIPPHAMRVSGLGELYTGARFCALTGLHASGSWDTDHTEALAAVAAAWWPQRPGSVAAAEWTDRPRDGYGGPADDEALLAIAMRSMPPGAAFGDGVAFRALWEADAAVLGRRFPSGDERPYDASRADAALASALAFWTGADCERIERLMWRSALAHDRAKWSRESYLRGTVAKYAGLCQAIYTGSRTPPPPEPAAAAAPVPALAAGEPPPVPAPAAAPVTDLSEQGRAFQGAIYIEDRYQAATPDGCLLTPQQFRTSSRYGGRTYTLDMAAAKYTRNAWEAFTESADWRPPVAHGLCFRPELPPRSLIQENGRTLYNHYTPPQVPRVAGDAGPFLRHLAKLLPDERDRAYLLSYMAAIVQHPGFKLQWAPLIQGAQGNGKTFLLSCMAYAVGEQYSHMPNAQDLSNRFNGWLEFKLFIGVEEIRVHDRWDMLDALKVMVTNSRVEMQRKGQDQITGDNRANFMLCTNHLDAIPLEGGDRRYGVFRTAQQVPADLVRDGMDGSYFPDLYRWAREGGFAIVAHYLATYQIADEFNPVTTVHRAPVTSGTAGVIEASRPAAAQVVIEAAAEGRVGFRRGWVSSYWLGLLLAEHRIKLHPNGWNKLLTDLGYVRPPVLTDGRAPRELASDSGRRSRLWVHRSHPAALEGNIADPGTAAALYDEANGMAAGSGLGATGRTSG